MARRSDTPSPLLARRRVWSRRHRRRCGHSRWLHLSGHRLRHHRVALEFVSAGCPLRDYPGGRRWDSALEGLAQTECDVMAEASGTNPREPEPALSHIRQALGRGTQVITSSKGACAAAAVEFLALARRRGVQCRMESTVMSGTPVLSTIREGLAG